MSLTPAHLLGSSSELFAASRFVLKGHCVYFPAMSQSKADFVADVDGRLVKVQVKSATQFNPKYPHLIQVRLGGSGRTRYEAEDFDLLAIVFQDRLWVLPTTDVDITQCSMSFSMDNVSGRKLKVDLSTYEWRN